ncbi:hypothetical protein [Streptacidiphilus albus]|uniref:hypothetical protein n=1 Tax=Streptacidiphilus albus TaxID=105425 RepID=UPI00054B37C4|nr:hypothetical protein [Streptacidiphilus albus]
MDPDTILRALRQLIARIDEIGREPEADWSGVATEALEGIEALDDWLTRGGHPPTAWTTQR